MMAEYSVTQWGSNPDEEDNDDCYTGEDFETREEAQKRFDELKPDVDVAYVMIDGPDVHQVRPNPPYHTPRARRERARERDEWRREQQMQAAMAVGVDGWNDYAGY